MGGFRERKVHEFRFSWQKEELDYRPQGPKLDLIKYESILQPDI
jgi:hypothetical protein